MTHFFIICILTQLLATLSTAISNRQVSEGKETFSKHIVTNEAVSVDVSFDGSGSHAFYFTSPRDHNKDGTHMISVREASGSQHAADIGACIRVFNEIVATETLIGCIGDAYVCQTGRIEESSACATRMAPHDIVDVMGSRRGTVVIVQGSTHSVGKHISIEYETADSQTCPDFTVNMTTERRITVQFASPSTSDGSVRMGWHSAAVHKGEISVDMDLLHPVMTPEARVLLLLPALPCYVDTTITVPSLFKLSSIFGDRLSVFMQYPSKKAAVYYPTRGAGLPPDTFAIVSLFNEKNSPVDMHTINFDPETDVQAFVDVSDCQGLHRVLLEFFYIGGGYVFSIEKTFNPASFCIMESLREDCFCRGHVAGRKGTTQSDISFDIRVPAATGGNLAKVVSMASPVQTHYKGTCDALSIETGRRYANNTATDGRECSIQLPSGNYIVTHALFENTPEDSPAVAEHTYDLVVVCGAHDPVLQSISVDARHGGVYYLHVDNGIACPPTLYDAGSAMRMTDAHTVSVEWQYSDTHGETFLPMTEYTDKTDAWYPDDGHYRATVTRNIDGVTSSHIISAIVEHPFRADMAPPCTSVNTTLTYNHLPQLDTDHSAHMRLDIRDTEADALVEWGLQISENGVAGKWIEVDASVPFMRNIMPRTDYSLRLLRVSYDHVAAMTARSACYHRVGAIKAIPPIVIRVLSPVQIFSCHSSDAPAMVLFDVYYENTDIPPIPYTGVGIEYYRIDKTVVTFIAGPIDTTSYKKGTLVLLFKMGIRGQIVVSELDEIMSSRLHPPKTTFAISDLRRYAADATSQDETAKEFHCGRDEHTDSHKLEIRTSNPTRLQHRVQGADGGDIEYREQRDADGHVSFFFAVRPVEIGSQEKSTVLVGLDPGLSTELMPRYCPSKALEYTLPPFIPLDITAELVPVSTDSTATHGIDSEKDILCSGKRLFVFRVLGANPSPVSYQTDGDADLGTVTIQDGIAFPVTIGRKEGIVINTYYTGASKLMGIRLSCSMELPASHFSAEAVQDSLWMMSSIEMTMYSQSKTSCSIDKSDGQKGGLVLMLSENSTTVPPLLYTPDAIPVLYRGYPSRPANNHYVYSGLGTGVYISELTLTGPSPSLECKRKKLFFVESLPDDYISRLVDIEKTSSGVKKMLCPQLLYADAGTWVEYYTVVFVQKILDEMTTRGFVVDVVFWKYGVMKPVATVRPKKNEINFRIPSPGTYIAEIVVTNSALSSRCNHPLPPYSVEAPLFTVQSFSMEVVKYPSCAYSSDGVIRINYPASVLSTVEISLMFCTSYTDGSSCVRGAEIDSDNKGFVYISDIPFASELIFRFEIMGACTFDGSYTFLPSPNMHPISAVLRYMPSCELIHTVRAFFVEGDFEAALTRGNGKTFEWSINSRVVQTDDVLRIDPREANGAVVSLIITYNGECKTSASIVLDNVFIPPRVVIDPLLYDTQTRSLPVFCPHAADAVLFATLDPPLADKSRVKWTSEAGEDMTSRVVYETPTTTLIHSLSAGAYRVEYTTGNGDLTCKSTDRAIVPAKEQYNAMDFLRISQAPCPGGVARAELLPSTGNSLTGAELNTFYGDMVERDDRKYINDRGSGATEMEGVPDGHKIRVMIPYDKAYVMRKRDFCETPLVLDFGRVATPPLFSVDMKDAAPYVYVPRWYGDVSVRQDARSVSMITTDGCETTIAPKTDSNPPSLVIKPIKQTLQCSYTRPEDVYVYRFYETTGDVFVHERLNPVHFAKYIAEIDSEFEITVPSTPAVLNKEIADALCNTNPTMKIRISFDVTANTVMHIDQAALSGYASTTGDIRCEWEAATVAICEISRTEKTTISVPYTSETGGECELSIDMHDMVDEAQHYSPPLEFSVVDAEAKEWKLCIGTSTSREHECYSGRGYTVREFKNVRDVGCSFRFTIAVSTDLIDKHARRTTDDQGVVAVQIMHPSCRGSSDAAIVWRINPDVDIIKEDTGKYHVTEGGLSDGTQTMTQSQLSAGTHWIRYTTRGESDIHYATALIVDPHPLSYVIQPSDLPPPRFKAGLADVVGIPAAHSGPLRITVYISGGSEATQVHITGVGMYSETTINIPCDIGYSDGAFWQYTCDASLLPGYRYSFDVTCGDSMHTDTKRMRRSGMHALSDLPQLQINARAKTLPMFSESVGGEIEIDIHGGMPPFTVLANARVAAKTNLRTVVVLDQPEGRVEIIVFDSFGSIASQEVALFSVNHQAELETSWKTRRQKGCGLETKTEVVVDIKYDYHQTLAIGAWCEDTGDAAILACSDTRMGIPFEYIDRSISFYLDHPGKWHIATCLGESLTLLPVLVETTSQQKHMAVETVDGEICLLSDGMYDTKRAPALRLAGDWTRAVARMLYSTETEPIYVQGREARLTGLVPGIYQYEVRDMETMCVAYAEVRVRDVGVGVCGTCDTIRETECIGCDGVAFSYARVDNCGVCNGNNACVSSCDIATGGDAIAMRQLSVCGAQGRQIVFTAPSTVDGFSITDSPSLRITGPVTFSGTTVLSSSTHITLEDGVVLTGTVVLNAADVAIRRATIQNCVLVFNNITEQPRPDARRRSRVTYNTDSETRTVLYGTTELHLTIENTPVHESDVVFNVTLVYAINVTNSTFETIRILGDFPSMNMTIDYNSTMSMIDITELGLPAGKTLDEFACILFTTIPTLEAIKSTSGNLFRTTYSCASFGEELSSDVMTTTDRNQAQTVAIVSSSLALFMLMTYALFNYTPRK